jgi:hypothetical protein
MRRAIILGSTPAYISRANHARAASLSLPRKLAECGQHVVKLIVAALYDFFLYGFLGYRKRYVSSRPRSAA